jgi:hypothetical protein
MTGNMTMDQLGDWMVEAGREACLARVAALVLRRLGEETKAILDAAVGLLCGQARQRDEADRIAELLAVSTPPEALSAAPVAPARGPMRLVDNVELRRGGMPHRDGSRHGRRMDQLSIMCRRAWERHDASGSEAPFRPPFDHGQISMCLHYQALIERHAAAGVKCASVEVRAVGRSGGKGDFLEAYTDEGREIANLHRRIGDGLALDVQRARGKAQPITARALVDAVCLHGLDLTAVLKRHGWEKRSDRLAILRSALAAALDRMQGYPQKGS